jgi:hypothetical protein
MTDKFFLRYEVLADMYHRNATAEAIKVMLGDMERKTTDRRAKVDQDGNEVKKNAKSRHHPVTQRNPRVRIASSARSRNRSTHVQRPRPGVRPLLDSGREKPDSASA